MTTSLKQILKISSILYIDDVNNVAQNIQNTLKIFCNEVYYTSDIEEASNIYLTKKPNIIISETSIHNNSPLCLLKEIRKYDYRTAMIITSKNKDADTLFKVIRLQAIDFLEKPFKVEYLIKTLNVTAKHILREGKLLVQLPDDYSYDYKNKFLNHNNTAISLTKNESRLIECLLLNNGKIKSKEEIEFYIWGEKLVNSSTFKSLFQRLKVKIGKNVIKNKSGLGYYITELS